MPRAAADRLLKAKGMPEVERRLNALDYQWHAKLKRWFQPYNVEDNNPSQTLEAA